MSALVSVLGGSVLALAGVLLLLPLPEVGLPLLLGGLRLLGRRYAWARTANARVDRAAAAVAAAYRRLPRPLRVLVVGVLAALALLALAAAFQHVRG